MAVRKSRPRGSRVESTQGDLDALNDEAIPQQPDTVTEAVRAKEVASEQQKEPKAKIKVVGDDGKSQYLDMVLLELVNEDWLAETYGGGKFQVYKEGVRDDGTWGYIGHDTHDIDKSLPFKGSLRRQRQEAESQREWDVSSRASLHNADGSPVPRQQGSPLVDTAVFNLLKAQSDSSNATNQFFLAQMEASRRAAETNQAMMMTMMEKMNKGSALESMMPLLLAVAPKVLEIVTTKKETTLETLLPLIESMRPKDEGQKLDDVLSLVGKLRETGLMDGNGGGGGWMDVIGKAVEALGPALIQAQQRPVDRRPDVRAVVTPAAQPAAPVLLAPEPSPSTSDSEVVIESADDVWRVIGERIGQVHLMAATGRRAERIALMVVEFASPAQLAILTEVLADETFEAQFLERFPQMKTYTRWTNEFIAVMRDELLGIPDEEDDDRDDDGEGAVTTPTGVPK